MFNRQALAQTWRDVRPYVIFSAILFFAGIVVGGTPNGAAAWLREQLEGIAKLSEQARSSDHPQLTFFALILMNNLVKCLMAIYLGAAAGILPLVLLVTNGLILGFLFGGLADRGENVWMLVAKGILPHGIFELPALFLACAFGIRFGMSLLRGLAGSLLGKTDPWGAFKRTASGSIPAVVLVSLLLLAAASIESTVTYWLMS